MSPGRGLPDLGAPVQGDGLQFFRAVDAPGQLVHVPTELEPAPRRDAPELPDLRVELVRGHSPAQPPSPYGVLDLRLRPRRPAVAPLDALRAQVPGATVTDAALGRGFLRLLLVAGGPTVDAHTLAALEEPAPVVGNGLDSGRVIRRLSVDATLLLRDVLKTGVLTFTAVAELSLRALADRVPATVRFDRAELMAMLHDRGDGQGRLPYEQVVAVWSDILAGRADLAGFDLDLRSATADHRLAAALADRTVAEGAEPAASPGRAVTPTVRLVAHPDDDPGQTIWDLSRGRTTTRVVLMRLDPFAAARRAVNDWGLEQVWQETIVPPLDVGVVDVEVDTNLPAPVLGVLQAGVELRAPPSPPARPHQLSGSVVFDAPAEQRRLTWRLAPDEPLRYDYTTFVLARRGGTVRRLAGPTRQAGARRLLIGVDDLAVQVVTVEAEPALLARALVRGRCDPVPDPQEGGSDVADLAGFEFTLTPDRPQVALALLPEDADRYRLALEACPPSQSPEGRCVALPTAPATATRVGLASFPQYGPQTVTIGMEFDVEVPLVAVELAPVEPVTGVSPSVLAFTPERAEREWHFLSPGPLDARFRYRGFGVADSSWSEPQPAARPLRLHASMFTAATTGDADVFDHPQGFRFAGLYCYPAGPPRDYFVVPLTPGPERGPGGEPALLLVAAAQGAMLQLGAVLGPDGAAVEALRRKLEELPAEGGPVRLSPGPVHVERAVLLLADDPDPVELAVSSTSGFPPYTAVFNVALTDPQREAVEAALSGEAGKLSVRYEARLGGRALDLVTDVAHWTHQT